MTTTHSENLPADDFALANAASLAVEARYGHDSVMRWVAEIPLEYRVAHFVWSVTGFAECEGYVAFLMSQCDHHCLGLSFRELGLADLAMTMDQMLAPIPESGVLGDEEALVQHFGDWERFADWVAQFETKLFGASKRIEHAAAEYCRAHSASFARLNPKIE